MAKYKLKPGTIEAFRWSGDWKEKEDPSWIVAAMKKSGGEIGAVRIMNGMVKIVGYNRLLTGYVGDYIIKGAEGRLYPCSPELFEMLFGED